MITKMMITVFISVLLTGLVPVKGNAATMTAYGSVSENTSQVRDLIDIMRTDDEYDPYNEFVVIRTAQDEYTIAFGKKLAERAVRYRYVTGQYGTIPSIQRDIVTQNSITKNGYQIVGNISGALASSRAETYKYQYVILIIGIMFLVLHGFKLFRKSESSKISYYGVR